MKVNIKFIMKKDDSNEIILLLNNNIVFIDNDFNNTLGEYGVELEKYKAMNIIDKFREVVKSLLDGYHFYGIKSMEEFFKSVANVDLEGGYEIIDDQICEVNVLKEIIEELTSDQSKYQTHILKNLLKYDNPKLPKDCDDVE